MNLDKLLEYQEEDGKLRKIETEIKASEEYKKYAIAVRFMKSAPEKLEQLDKRASELKALVEELDRQNADITGEIEEYAELDDMVEGGGDLSYYEKTLRALKNQLATLRTKMDELQGKISKTLDEYTALLQQKAAMQKQGKEYQAKYEAIREARAGEADELKKKMAKIAKEIPAEILTKYNAKKAEKIYPVFVPLTDRSCRCGMTFSLAQESSLSGGNVIECEQCHCFVYKK